jgi:hypothetical protein
MTDSEGLLSSALPLVLNDPEFSHACYSPGRQKIGSFDSSQHIHGSSMLLPTTNKEGPAQDT